MTRDEGNSIVIIDGKVAGVTQYAANLIQMNANADIFRIERQELYPTNHAMLLKTGKKEHNTVKHLFGFKKYKQVLF